jgi:hypothetical protein
MPTKPLLEKTGIALVIATLLTLALLAWLALRPVIAPAALGSDTPAAAFATSRALPAFKFLASAPRPIASANNVRAREYIVERLQSLDLAPQVQSASAQQANVSYTGGLHVSAGIANNILVRVDGKAKDHAQRPALLIASYYDSAPDQVGAGASSTVAAMLETLRALQHGPPLANDLIFLFADGEKSGALGAHAFAEQHPWARHVGLVLQFDAAGNSGPLLLMASRGGDENMVKGWLAAAPLAVGSSDLPLLVRDAPALLQGGPLDTIGTAGMRFANIEGGTGYRASFDTPDLVARSTMQHAGETMLALARHFGNQPLANIGGADAVYFSVPLLGQIQYSSDQVWPLTRLVCFMLFLACCVAVKHMDMEVRQLGAGALAFLLLGFALALTAITLWKGFPGLHQNYAPMASGAGARDHWYFLAYVTLGMAVFIELQRLLHKLIGIPATTLGALLVLVLLLVGASWITPGASYLLAWPMLTTLLAYGLLLVPRVAALPAAIRMGIKVAGVAPAILLLAPVLQQVATLFTPERSALLMLVLSAMLGLGTTLLASLRRRFIAPLLMLACAGALFTATGTRQYDHAMVTPNRMTYVHDAYSWKAWWVMPAEPLDAWSRPFFADTGGPRELREIYGASRADQWVARAAHKQVALPDIVVLRDDDDGESRKIVFTLRSKNKAPTIDLRVDGASTLRAALDGKVVTSHEAKAWSMSLHGTGDSAHRFELVLSSGTIARVYIAERIPGLPGGVDAARPAHIPLTAMTVASDMLVFR